MLHKYHHFHHCRHRLSIIQYRHIMYHATTPDEPALSSLFNQMQQTYPSMRLLLQLEFEGYTAQDNEVK